MRSLKTFSNARRLFNGNGLHSLPVNRNQRKMLPDRELNLNFNFQKEIMTPTPESNIQHILKIDVNTQHTAERLVPEQRDRDRKTKTMGGR